MLSMKDMGIRTKVIASMFVLIVFIALLSFWVSYAHEKRGLLTNMQSNASILNRALIVSLTSRKSIGEKVNLQTLVEELSLTEGVFGVWVIDNGARITSATFREQVGEVVPSSLVLESLQEGYYVSGFDKKMGEEVYTAIYPFTKGDHIMGVLEVAFEMREYLRSGSEDQALLLEQMERDSRIMAESLSYSIKNMRDVNELIHIQRLVDRLTRESEIISRIMIVDDNSRIIAANDLNSVGMIAEDKGVSDATNYYTHLSEIFRFGLLISAMGILMGILLSFQVSNPIVEPLRRLTDVTKRLAAGDLSQRATVGSKDEVGILAGAFNQMAHDLARYKEEADQYSKTLEEKVRQRTQALEISNQELRTIQNELMEANMVKSEFMSIASHELRTPLTTLLGYSELLLTRPLTDSQEKEFLGFINEESIRLSRIVDDLLDISRIESQKDFGFVRKPFSPAELVRKNIKVYAGTEAGHRIVAEVEENLPLVNVDAEKMGQVIKNLLDNAIKYSPFGDIVCKAFSENNMVWISVQDSGIGIFEGDIPRIFNKFFRVERKETEHVSGTGLGLSIAKYIVESHNGEITVESELDKGTTVSFGLPIYKD